MIGPVQLLIVLIIVIAIFGTKKLGNLGEDLGNAIKGFKNALKEDETAENSKPAEKLSPPPANGNVIEGEVTRDKESNKQG